VRAGCAACEGRWPAPDHHIVDLTASTVHLHADQFFPGWCVLVLRRHATELYELAPVERHRLMDEVSAVALAVTRAFDARKVNYALFGNLLPHVHWHVIPRLAGDPAPGEAVFAVPHTPVGLAGPPLAERIARIRAGLAP
jgi:diadenosine tetraphosphate (Ap4A) HIT family hydrolase